MQRLSLSCPPKAKELLVNSHPLATLLVAAALLLGLPPEMPRAATTDRSSVDVPGSGIADRVSRLSAVILNSLRTDTIMALDSCETERTIRPVVPPWGGGHVFLWCAGRMVGNFRWAMIAHRMASSTVVSIGKGKWEQYGFTVTRLGGREALVDLNAFDETAGMDPEKVDRYLTIGEGVMFQAIAMSAREARRRMISAEMDTIQKLLPLQ